MDGAQEAPAITRRDGRLESIGRRQLVELTYNSEACRKFAYLSSHFASFSWPCLLACDKRLCDNSTKWCHVGIPTFPANEFVSISACGANNTSAEDYKLASPRPSCFKPGLPALCID